MDNECGPQTARLYQREITERKAKEKRMNKDFKVQKRLRKQKGSKIAKKCVKEIGKRAEEREIEKWEREEMGGKKKRISQE